MTNTKTVTMTRDEVIAAIETETRLQTGVWIDIAEDHITDKYEELADREKHCHVCAVGAVLWEAKVPSECINDVASGLTDHDDVSVVCAITSTEDLTKTMALSPFATLSRVFESTYREMYEGLSHNDIAHSSAESAYYDPVIGEQALAAAREMSIKFVRRHFPDTITFTYDVDSAKAAKWVTV